MKLPRYVYSPNSEVSASNDGKIPGFCKFLCLLIVIKFDNEMSAVKTKITIAQVLFMQSLNLPPGGGGLPYGTDGDAVGNFEFNP